MNFKNEIMKRCFFLLLLIGISLNCQAQEKILKTSDNVELYINVKGTGIPCLYIHGGPGSGSFWMEKFMGDFLEQHFQMIYLDQRGVGRSSSPSDNNYSMDRMIQDFEEVRKSLGIKKWVTLGHSFGGILQMGYVQRFPKSVNGMIMINCTLSLNQSFEYSWLPKAIELAGEQVPAICYNKNSSVYERMLAIMPVLNEKDMMWKIFFNSKDDSKKLNETYRDFTAWNSHQSEHILEYNDFWNDYRHWTKKMKQPVLFYYGKTDWSIGPEHYKSADFPNMLLWGSDVGHMPFLENKSDLENAILQYLTTIKD